MSDLNYGLGFYLIEVATNQYDLFNSVTDNKVLKAEPREKIINFLETNFPTHPFLCQVDQEISSYYSGYIPGHLSDYITEPDVSKYMPEDPSESVEDSFYAPPFNYENNYTSTPVYNPDFVKDHMGQYSSIDYDASYSNGFVEREDIREEDDSVQLEFNFTYKDSKDNEITFPNNSPDSKVIMNEYFGEDIPYLPDDTEGDTD